MGYAPQGEGGRLGEALSGLALGGLALGGLALGGLALGVLVFGGEAALPLCLRSCFVAS